MVEELRGDYRRYPGRGWRRFITALSTPGFYAIVVYRFGYDIYHRWPRVLAWPAKIVYRLLAFATHLLAGIYIAPDAAIGPGLYIGHWGCIRIGRSVRLGVNCNISSMVVMGQGVYRGKRGVPWLGDRVYVAAGAKIFGPIRVGNDVAIGANAVVCRDVPDHVTVGGVPAQVISEKGSAAYIELGRDLDVRAAEVTDDVPPTQIRNPGA